MLLNITELSVSTEYYETISECHWIVQPSLFGPRDPPKYAPDLTLFN